MGKKKSFPRETVTLMRSPWSWGGDCLSVKKCRKGHAPVYGVLREAPLDKVAPIVYLASLSQSIHINKWEAVKQQKFASFKAMVESGWLIDPDCGPQFNS